MLLGNSDPQKVIPLHLAHFISAFLFIPFNLITSLVIDRHSQNIDPNDISRSVKHNQWVHIFKNIALLLEITTMDWCLIHGVFLTSG